MWAAVVIGRFSAVVLQGDCAVCSLVTKEEPHFSEGSRAAVGMRRVRGGLAGGWAGPCVVEVWAAWGGAQVPGLPAPVLVGAGSGGPCGYAARGRAPQGGLGRVRHLACPGHGF